MSEPDKRDGLSAFGGSGVTEDAKGSDLILSPLRMSDYVSIRDESLARYRREQLKLITENRDLFSEAEYIEMRDKEMIRVRQIEYEDLPDKEIVEYEDDANAYRLPEEQRVVKSKHRVEYALWWMSSSPAGMLFALWLSARREPSQSHLTLSEVENRFSSDVEKYDIRAIESAAARLSELSTPKIAGNGDAVDAPAEKKKRRRRRKLRKR